MAGNYSFDLRIAEFQKAAPMDDLLHSIPLQVVLDEHLGLHGAAWLAAQLEHATGVQP
jgi:glucokinase